MTIICRILANNAAKGVVLIELIKKDGAARQIPIARAQDFSVNFGDRLKSLAGTAIVMINPGTKAGTFILSPNAPKNDWKHRVELEINEETTKIIARGHISVADEIGSITRATGATTR